MKLSRIQIEPTAAGAPAVIPSGVFEYHEDTKKFYKSDGTTKTEIVSGSGYTDEQAQDAVGAMVDSTLVYTDGTPLLSRAALTGDVTASAGSNATTIANDAVTFAKIQNITDNRLLGRSSGSTGDTQEVTPSTGLLMASAVLRSNQFGRIDYKTGSADTPDDDFDSGTLDAKWTVVTGASGTVDLLETGTTVAEYDLATRPGWMLMQAGRNTGQEVALRQDYTVPDGNSILCAVAVSYGAGTTTEINNATQIRLSLNDNNTSSRSGNYVEMSVDSQASTAPRIYVASSVGADFAGAGLAVRVVFFRIARSGLVYYPFFSADGSTWTPCGSRTFGSALDNVWIRVECLATITSGCPVPIVAYDWVRLGTNGLDPW